MVGEKQQQKGENQMRTETVFLHNETYGLNDATKRFVARYPSIKAIKRRGHYPNAISIIEEKGRGWVVCYKITD